MCWFYMGIAKIALDPPPLCQTGKHGEKKCPKSSWQAFNSPLLTHIENNTFQKGPSLIRAEPFPVVGVPHIMTKGSIV